MVMLRWLVLNLSCGGVCRCFVLEGCGVGGWGWVRGLRVVGRVALSDGVNWWVIVDMGG